MLLHFRMYVFITRCYVYFTYYKKYESLDLEKLFEAEICLPVT